MFESSEYNLDELHVTITDGTFAKRYIVKDGRFDISEYCKNKYGIWHTDYLKF